MKEAEKLKIIYSKCKIEEDFNLSLREAIILESCCNSVISTRSGFCDILSYIGKKLYVLYSKERYKDLSPFFY